MFAIVTISDSRSSGQARDESGETLNKVIVDAGFQVVERKIVPDDYEAIKELLVHLSEGSSAVDCIITTGGTGMCPRDVTPEVVRTLIHRETPGISTALLVGSLSITPKAMTSRLTSGIRYNTLIICFPGSPKACRECFAILAPALSHCLSQVKGDLEKVLQEHCCTQERHENNPQVLLDERRGVAYRPRQSPYEMIEVKNALEIIRKEIKQKNDFQEISITKVEKLLGKVLYEDIVSPVNIPPFPASIKDGYAVIASDGVGERKVLSFTSTAGIEPNNFKVTTGYCMRISTGAPLPDGSDSVIQVEDTELIEATLEGEERIIVIKTETKRGQEIRPIGCDIQQGECILLKGTTLGPSQLGILASIGLKTVKVVQVPVFGVLSTGDEIIEAASDAMCGKIWDSNKTQLKSLLAKNNFDYIDFGIAKDEYSQVREKLGDALDKCKAIITTGGVSMGEKDLIKVVAQKEFGATLHFGRVNMKPGKPTTFMTCDWNGDKKIIFGLPGNPVSAQVTFTLFVLPTLRHLSGLDFIGCNSSEAKLVIPNPIKLDIRPEYARGIQTKSGLETIVHLVTGSRRSSRLMSNNGANVLVFLPSSSHEKDTICNGDIVSVIPFD